MTSSEPGVPHPDPAQLASVALFASLTPEQLLELATLMDVDYFPAGKAMVREGVDGYSFHILLDGTAEVRHGDVTVRTLGVNDYFGELAIVQSTRRTATVVAVSPCVLASMFGTTFRKLASEHPDIAAALEDVARARRD